MAFVRRVQIQNTLRNIYGGETYNYVNGTTITAALYKMTICSVAVSSLTVTLGTADQLNGVPAAYHLRFTVSGSSFSLVFSGSTVIFNNTPEWEDGHTYEVSIVDGYAIVADFTEP